MFPIPTLYLRLAGAAIIALLIGWHLYGDWSIKRDLAAVSTELATAKADLKTAQDQLLQVTRDRDEFQKASNEADKARAQVQSDLQATLKKLRNQKPPTECKAAIDWAVQNKDDLKWETK